jgi:hypothetical protein
LRIKGVVMPFKVDMHPPTPHVNASRTGVAWVMQDPPEFHALAALVQYIRASSFFARQQGVIDEIVWALK